MEFQGHFQRENTGHTAVPVLPAMIRSQLGNRVFQSVHYRKQLSKTDFTVSSPLEYESTSRTSPSERYSFRANDPSRRSLFAYPQSRLYLPMLWLYAEFPGFRFLFH